MSINLPESLICILANPDKSSSAANETFKSVFQDDINRWQLKYVALTNKAWALSKWQKIQILMDIKNLFSGRVQKQHTKKNHKNL
jgi:hypothetical protein